MQIPIRLTVICLCLFGSGCDSTRSSDRGVSVAISSEAANSNAVHETDNAPVTTDRSGHDWPVFLGPHGTGVSDETGLLDEWPATGPRMLWEKRIGKGYSSPRFLMAELLFIIVNVTSTSSSALTSKTARRSGNTTTKLISLILTATTTGRAVRPFLPKTGAILLVLRDVWFASIWKPGSLSGNAIRQKNGRFPIIFLEPVVLRYLKATC